MTQISSYYSKVGISVDLAQLKKVDRYLKLLEAKMMAFQKRAMRTNGAFNINFKFNTNRLQFDVQKAFNDVSRRISFPINRFDVNRAALSSSINSAVRAAMAGTNATLRINPRVNQQAQGRPLPGQQITGRHAAFAGGAAGMFGRYGAPAIIGGAAIYGGAALNRANQEAMSMRLTTQAVVQAAGGTEQQGKDAFGWLRNLANEVGFSYKDAAPDYNQFLANAQGAGLDIGESQNIFQGLSEYQTAMGVTPARRKLVMNAASQMLGKQTLSMEELRRQMAESLPGTMDIFGEAFAEMSGSGLKGPEALKALYEAVPTGTVNSAEILKHVDVIMRRRAAPKLDVMKKTSIAEQGRSQNVISDFMALASTSGIEEGFSRIFRTFNEALSKSDGLIKSLASGFNTVTEAARNLLLVPQSISRMFSGEDSVVGDWMRLQGPEGEKIVLIMSQIKSIFSGMGDLINKSVEGWKELFKVLSDVGAFDKMLEVINNILWLVSSITKAVQAATNQDWGGVMEAMKDAGSAAILVSPGNMLLPDSVRNPLLERREKALGGNPDVNNVFGKQQRIDRFNAEGPAGVLPMTREQQASAAAATVPISSGSGFIMGDINIEVSGMEFTGMNAAEAMDRLASKVVDQVQDKLVGAALLMYPTTQ